LMTRFCARSRVGLVVVPSSIPPAPGRRLPALCGGRFLQSARSCTGCSSAGLLSNGTQWRWGPAPGACAPGAECRQPPAPAGAGASSPERGSSPVSVLNAAGIWRRRGTPSFWRRTSQCALTVRGEMPSRSPISSFEQPNAISPTTSVCRSVNASGASLGVLLMSSTLRRGPNVNHRPKGVLAVETGVRRALRGSRRARSSTRARAR
jgi:hypothetical protein